MNIAQVRRHAMSLPEVTKEPHFDYANAPASLKNAQRTRRTEPTSPRRAIDS